MTQLPNDSFDPTAIDITFDPLQQRMIGIARAGNTPFDVPYISEIGDNLWQGGCATGLLLPKHIKHVVSMYPWERYTISHELLSFNEYPMYDSEDQTYEMLDTIAAWVNECRKTGPTLVHCQAGLNRSSLVAARALMLDGMSADQAISLIRLKRSPACLCNKAFENYLRSI